MYDSKLNHFGPLSWHVSKRAVDILIFYHNIKHFLEDIR